MRTFETGPGAEIGFTDTDGRQVTRRANAAGTITARSEAEETIFSGFGFKELVEEPKTKGPKKRSSKKTAPAATKRTGLTLLSGAPVDTSTDDAVRDAGKEE